MTLVIDLMHSHDHPYLFVVCFTDYSAGLQIIKSLFSEDRSRHAWGDLQRLRHGSNHTHTASVCQTVTAGRYTNGLSAFR